MKNQKEIYEALLAGENLINAQSGAIVCLENNFVFNIESNREFPYRFNDVDNWSIHKEPKWYENIPEGGVLCWQNYKDGAQGMHPILVTKAIKLADVWMYSTLTKQELRVFIDNAPEQ